MKALQWFLFFALAISASFTVKSQPAQAGQSPAGNDALLTLPSATKVELSLTVPLWANKVKPGDTFYSETNFPVIKSNKIAIPSGTYVEGRILSVAPRTRKLKNAVLQVLFTKIIFANGYTIELPAKTSASDASSRATVMQFTIEITPYNDLILDNGAQMEMAIGAPLALDVQAVTKAIPLTHAVVPGTFKTATLCRYIPATSGTPDTTIPGTPGTPSITIPGGPGMPSTTIPGTPGTPSSTIPGTPGSPGIYCPPAPTVISSTPMM